ncbi:MAG: 16S rRNA (cytidine(1402)-2'-O)-methyltransferase [Lachnospiraceae bacterium]|nr:16S rRNA (cytidine(1402)-2'-O)-methyltransferase [Lachnospiraceae bacterium]
MAGKLYLCATPIGNLGDITARTLECLKQVDIIAAEDTRNSMKLMTHFDIHTPLTSYHEYNKYDKADKLVGELLAGKDIALITDAGTPAISDPGEVLVRKCQEAGIGVTSLPGPSAVITALTLSGLPTRRFTFEGFLPQDKAERREILEELKDEYRTVVLYEAPHHLINTLAELNEYFGDRRLTIARELTKKHEEILKFTVCEALSYYEHEEPRGEFVLVLEGRDRQKAEAEKRAFYEEMSPKEHVEKYISEGMDRKAAMKQAAKDRGVSKRDIYKALL